jgi:hypothetical protein
MCIRAVKCLAAADMTTAVTRLWSPVIVDEAILRRFSTQMLLVQHGILMVVGTVGLGLKVVMLRQNFVAHYEKRCGATAATGQALGGSHPN